MAPVLARIDKIPGVLESRVDWTGRYLLLTLDPTVNRELLPKEVSSVVGTETRSPSPETEARLMAGGPWLRSGETLQLSQAEADGLAKLTSSKVAAQVPLSEDQTRRLQTILREELRAAFERVHQDAGFSKERFLQERRIVINRVGERLQPFLPEDLRARIVQGLTDSMDRSIEKGPR